MSLMQAPVGIILIHRAKVQEAQMRDQHPHLTEIPRMAVRAGIGRVLISLGLWLAPQHDGTERAGGRLATVR